MEQIIYLTYSHTDYNQHWKLADMFTIFSEMAVVHAESFGGWRKELGQTHGWIISKMRIQLYSQANYLENVTVKTWISQGTNVIFPRSFEVRGEDGRLIAVATSNWSLIDLVKRRIAFPKRVNLLFPIEIMQDAPLQIETNFDDENDYTFVERRQVRYGDIDINGHLNNARYVEWACDVLGYDSFKDKNIGDLSIQFKKETAPNEWLNLEKKCDGDLFKVRGLDDQGEIHFICEGVWKKF